MNKFFILLFIGEDGTLSTSKISALLGIAMMLHIYVQVFVFGTEYTETRAFMAELLLGIAFGLRGVDRFSRYGLSSVIGTKKKEAEKSTEVKGASSKTTKSEGVKTLESNFSLAEFASRDGAPMPAVVVANLEKHMMNLEVIREAAGGKAITISSGYRSKAHNAKVGGKPNSQHLYGNAADIKVKGMRPASVAKLIKKLMDAGEIEAGGLKAYDTFTHYDRRGDYVTW